MAIVNPQVPLFDRAQDGTCTVTLASPTDISGWAVSAILRAYKGGTALATKTVGSGITSTYSSGTQTWVITFSDDDLDIAPGGYVWDFRRTDAGAEYEIVEPSAFIIRSDAVTGGPTITNLSEYLINSMGNLSLASNDNLARQLTQTLESAEDHIKRFCNRDFVYRSAQTEYYDGNGTPDLYLRRDPVAANGITTVKLDLSGMYGSVSGSFGADTELTSGEDYFLKLDAKFGDGLNSGVIQRLNGVWPLRERRPVNRLAAGVEPLPGCIQVVYAGGFQLMPYSLKNAVWDIATFMFQRSPSARLAQSESGEGYSVSYMDWDREMRMIGSVQMIVNTFQRLYPG